MQGLGSAASIIAAIREEAAAESDRIDDASAIEIDGIRAEAAGTAVVIADRDAQTVAERADAEERIARQEWEGRRMVIEQRETWIDRVTAAARRRWRLDRAQLTALIAEALKVIDGPEVEIAVAERDRATVETQTLGRTVRMTTADIEGGCIVSAGDLVFDNSLEARSRRLEPLWRKALSEVYRP